MSVSLQYNDNFTNIEINDIIDHINIFRKEFDVPILSYDDNLTKLAKTDAINHLRIKTNKIVTNINLNLISNNNYSKNITFVNQVRNDKIRNIKNIINKWYNEKKYYDFDNENNTKYDECQNFINLIYESNIKCGFGYSYSNGKCSLCIYLSE
jgi:hypothetical protein